MLRFDFAEAVAYMKACDSAYDSLERSGSALRRHVPGLSMQGLVGAAGDAAGLRLQRISVDLDASIMVLDALRLDFSCVFREAQKVKCDCESVAAAVGAHAVITAWTRSALAVDQGAVSSLAHQASSVANDCAAPMERTVAQLMGSLPASMGFVAVGTCRALSSKIGDQRARLDATARALDALSSSVSEFESRYVRVKGECMSVSADSATMPTSTFAAGFLAWLVDEAPDAFKDFSEGVLEGAAKNFEGKVSDAAKAFGLEKFGTYEQVGDYIIFSGYDVAEGEVYHGPTRVKAENLKVNSGASTYADAIDMSKTAKGLSKTAKIGGGIAGIALGALELQETYDESLRENADLPIKQRNRRAAADTFLGVGGIAASAAAGAAAGALVGGACGGLPAIPGALIGAVVGIAASAFAESAYDFAVDADFNEDGVTFRDTFRDYVAGE